MCNYVTKTCAGMLLGMFVCRYMRKTCAGVLEGMLAFLVIWQRHVQECWRV